MLYGSEEAIAKGAVPAAFRRRRAAESGAPARSVRSVSGTRTLGDVWARPGSLLKAPWPKYDAALAKEEEIEIPVQVNGKLRSRVTVPADADEAFVLERALADDKVEGRFGGKQIVKKIYVPGKMVNLVVK